MATAKAPLVSRFGGFPPAGVAWFRELAYEQDRDWFQANRERYETLWLAPMKALLAELEAPVAKVYGKKLGPPKIFRLNRDLRFAKDKSPYKTNIAALLPFAGFAPMQGPAALYLHLGLEEVVAFGFYMLEPSALQRLRKRILDEKAGRAVQKLVDAAVEKGLSPDGMEKLKRAPPGVSPDHPRIELLKYKALALSRETIPKGVRFTPALKGWLVEQATAAAPLVKWGFGEKLSG
jgi:uncharacterized protein (TIGR02453 family)